MFRPKTVEVNPLIDELQSLYSEEEIQGIIGLKKDSAPVELVEIHTKSKNSLDEGNRKVCKDVHKTK